MYSDKEVLKFFGGLVSLQFIVKIGKQLIKEDNSYIVRHHLSWCWGPMLWYAESPQVVLRYLRNIVLRDGVLD